MKAKPILFTALMTAGTASAQTDGYTMKKFEDQLPQQGRGNVRVEYLGKSIDRMIYEFMEERGIPGMTLAIVQAPYVSRVAGYGITDLENGRLASPKTLWPAGPISQGFAAVAVMQLVEQGKLHLDDELSKFVRGIPQTWVDITVLQLLQHSSGIPDYRNARGHDFPEDFPVRQALDAVRNEPLAFEPGTEVRQSATDFLLLTEIIARTSGMPYREFVRENQIERLGLTETFFTGELGKVDQEDLAKSAGLHERFKHEANFIDPTEVSSGYTEQDGRLVAAAAVPALPGFSDIWASAEDISRWDIGLAGGVLVEKPENRAVIYGPAVLDGGNTVPAMAGWQFYAHAGLMDIKGSVSGYSVFLSRFTDPSELVCVTLMANKEGVDLTNLARRIAAAYDSSKLGTGADDNLLYTYESPFGADETMERVEAQLKKLGIPVFARFDHALNAREAGLAMPPTKVVVFGSPKVGTGLMLENPSVAIELPLRIAVWEDANGSVWVAFRQMDRMAAEYGLEDNPVVGKMQQLLEGIVRGAANVYEM